MSEHEDFFRIPARSLGASEFWEVYFSGHLSELQRDLRTGDCQGVYDLYTPGQLLPREQPFSVSLSELRRYDFAADFRFQSGPQSTLGQCIATVLALPVMRVETVPNQHQLELARRLCGFEPEEPLEYEKLRLALIERFERLPLPLEAVLKALQQTRPGAEDHQLYEETGRTSALKVERVLLVKALALSAPDPRVTEALAGIVESDFEDFETVATAIWAVGRHNDKAAIPRLLMWLGQKRLGLHTRGLGLALQFLCSGERLIPLSYEDEPAYWREVVKRLPRKPDEWVRWDCASVFWQKRLGCALHAGSLSVKTRLLEDEVLPVRLAAIALPG